MLTHKTHGVYAKSYARKTVVVLAFRAEKVQRIQGVLRPHQVGVGIYGLPLRLRENTTVSATISEPISPKKN